MKKILSTVLVASSLLLYSTPSFALLSLSVGVPIGAAFTATNEDGSTTEADGASGYFLGVQLPFGPGLGIDSHTTKIKDSTLKVVTSMYNLYYQLPIPVVSLIVGLGIGNSNFDCPDVGNGTACADNFDKGSAQQWYTSIGIPLIPLFDIHLSYRSITSKDGKYKGKKTDSSTSTVMGAGIAFNF